MYYLRLLIFIFSFSQINSSFASTQLLDNGAGDLLDAISKPCKSNPIIPLTPPTSPSDISTPLEQAPNTSLWARFLSGAASIAKKPWTIMYDYVERKRAEIAEHEKRVLAKQATRQEERKWLWRLYGNDIIDPLPYSKARKYLRNSWGYVASVSSDIDALVDDLDALVSEIRLQKLPLTNTYIEPSDNWEKQWNAIENELEKTLSRQEQLVFEAKLEPRDEFTPDRRTALKDYRSIKDALKKIKETPREEGKFASIKQVVRNLYKSLDDNLESSDMGFIFKQPNGNLSNDKKSFDSLLKLLPKINLDKRLVAVSTIVFLTGGAAAIDPSSLANNTCNNTDSLFDCWGAYALTTDLPVGINHNEVNSLVTSSQPLITCLQAQTDPFVCMPQVNQYRETHGGWADIISYRRRVTWSLNPATSTSAHRAYYDPNSLPSALDSLYRYDGVGFLQYEQIESQFYPNGTVVSLGPTNTINGSPFR